jgi:hypothetical protein
MQRNVHSILALIILLVLSHLVSRFMLLYGERRKRHSTDDGEHWNCGRHSKATKKMWPSTEKYDNQTS